MDAPHLGSLRVLVASASGKAPGLRAYRCEELVAVPDSSGQFTVAGSPAWSLLIDCDLMWIDGDAVNATEVGAAALVTAAAACQVPVFTDLNHAIDLDHVDVSRASSLHEVVAIFDVDENPPTPSAALAKLQRYYARMARIRKYGTTDEREGLLLLTEEIGELAHAMRKSLDLDRTRPYAPGLNVAEELADVQLFVLNLANLLKQSLADAVLEKERTNHGRATHRLPNRRQDDQVTLVSIEGLIGSGKTTTTRLLAAATGATPIYERVESHPFLEAFYRDGLAHVLEVELAFILMHWHSIRSSRHEPRAVADFCPFKDLVFSQILVEDQFELDLVNRMHSELWHRAMQPGLTVFLDLDPEVALQRIHIRGRPFEQEIDAIYLSQLRSGYLGNIEHLGNRAVTLEIDGAEDEHRVASRVLGAIREVDQSWSQAELIG